MISNSAENQTATFRAPYNFGSGRKCLFQQRPGDGSVKLIFLSKRELLFAMFVTVIPKHNKNVIRVML